MNDTVNSINKGMKELSELDLSPKSDNVIPLRLITDGGGPTNTGFWLLDLAVGDVFLARQKPNNQNMRRTFELTEYGIFSMTAKAVHLLVAQPGQTVPVWVDGRAFSNEFEYFETLRTNDPRIMEARSHLLTSNQKEPTNGDNLRTVQPE